MPSSPTRPRRRAPNDRLLTLTEAASLAGYSPEFFRKMRDGFPMWCHTAPPFVQIAGRKKMLWKSDLTRWAKLYGIPLRKDEVA